MEADLHTINMKYNILFYKNLQKMPFSTLTFTIPNLHSVEMDYHFSVMSRKPVANYIHEQMTDKMKIKLVDDLFEQGYIRKIQDDNIGESYEIKVVR